MKHLQSLLFAILLSLPALGQDQAQQRHPGQAVTLFMVDGSEIDGYVAPIIMGSRTFWFSTEPNGDHKRMRVDKVHRLRITDGTHTAFYEVVKLRKRPTNRRLGWYVLSLEVDGYMKLYGYYDQLGQVTDYFIKKSPTARGAYAVGRAFTDPEPNKFEVLIQKSFDKKFRRTGAWFFADHPEIVQQIKDRQVSTLGLAELVHRYNQDKEKP